MESYLRFINQQLGSSGLALTRLAKHLDQTEPDVNSTISLYENDPQLAIAVQLRKREI